MKALDIAFKDLLRSWRSAFTVVMMFIVPLLITGLIYLAFGGLSGSGEVSIEQIKLGLVNLDLPAGDIQVSLANELEKTLTEDSLKELLAITEYPSETAARQAILDKQVSVALVIPADFSASVLQPEGHVTLDIIHDPASSLAPAIVRSIVGQFVDGFNGSQIAVKVAVSRLEKDGLKTDVSVTSRVSLAYFDWAIANVPGSKGALPFVELQAPTASTQGKSAMQAIAGVIMAGMIVYFVFYTGALNAQSIIQEQDEQTLARLAATPTSPGTILVGKVIGSMILISVQIVVLMLLSNLLFKIDWGNLWTIGLVSVVLVFLAAGFGIFLMSFIKNSRQTGIVLGGVLTLLGMFGGLFTGGFQSLPKAFEVATLFTPHGWAYRAYKIALGDLTGNLAVPLLVMAAMGVVSMVIGIILFRRRFA
jgi:ABC-2 type transport system permease protein